uniref:Uncharacterized protein n=1 Tax=Chromera velia CCMP2878 TaxID=1169474 RepID=A0A0G4HIQ9_9ALVE|eukprot:Cvel_1078.t1-p1 / transcript=Cvel_1078.t1 / gene=Cvel_1078 / organism=Chromera_velia_CCMP2878 / gene_product=hypothetical protein / transcript_product=hypothetical protein / location=Cvel_scaffold35:41153-44056(-) / protein_length=968 / sequence_SO=supercontig / SO=protein_coding / is_pseudo=false
MSRYGPSGSFAAADLQVRRVAPSVQAHAGSLLSMKTALESELFPGRRMGEIPDYGGVHLPCQAPPTLAPHISDFTVQSPLPRSPPPSLECRLKLQDSRCQALLKDFRHDCLHGTRLPDSVPVRSERAKESERHSAPSSVPRLVAEIKAAVESVKDARRREAEMWRSLEEECDDWEGAAAAGLAALSQGRGGSSGRVEGSSSLSCQPHPNSLSRKAAETSILESRLRIATALQENLKEQRTSEVETRQTKKEHDSVLNFPFDDLTSKRAPLSNRSPGRDAKSRKDESGLRVSPLSASVYPRDAPTSPPPLASGGVDPPVSSFSLALKVSRLRCHPLSLSPPSLTESQDPAIRLLRGRLETQRALLEQRERDEMEREAWEFARKHESIPPLKEKEDPASLEESRQVLSAQRDGQGEGKEEMFMNTAGRPVGGLSRSPLASGRRRRSPLSPLSLSVGWEETDGEAEPSMPNPSAALPRVSSVALRQSRQRAGKRIQASRRIRVSPCAPSSRGRGSPSPPVTGFSLTRQNGERKLNRSKRKSPEERRLGTEESRHSPRPTSLQGNGISRQSPRVTNQPFAFYTDPSPYPSPAPQVSLLTRSLGGQRQRGRQKLSADSGRKGEREEGLGDFAEAERTVSKLKARTRLRGRTGQEVTSIEGSRKERGLTSAGARQTAAASGEQRKRPAESNTRVTHGVRKPLLFPPSPVLTTSRSHRETRTQESRSLCHARGVASKGHSGNRQGCVNRGGRVDREASRAPTGKRAGGVAVSARTDVPVAVSSKAKPKKAKTNPPLRSSQGVLEAIRRATALEWEGQTDPSHLHAGTWRRYEDEHTRAVGEMGSRVRVSGLRRGMPIHLASRRAASLSEDPEEPFFFVDRAFEAAAVEAEERGLPNTEEEEEGEVEPPPMLFARVDTGFREAPGKGISFRHRKGNGHDGQVGVQGKPIKIPSCKVPQRRGGGFQSIPLREWKNCS